MLSKGGRQRPVVLTAHEDVAVIDVHAEGRGNPSLWEEKKGRGVDYGENRGNGGAMGGSHIQVIGLRCEVVEA